MDEEEDLKRRARKEDLAPRDWAEDEERLWLRRMPGGMRGLVERSGTTGSSSNKGPVLLGPDAEGSREGWVVVSLAIR
jgi:hypothetical protein